MSTSFAESRQIIYDSQPKEGIDFLRMNFQFLYLGEGIFILDFSLQRTVGDRRDPIL